MHIWMRYTRNMKRKPFSKKWEEHLMDGIQAWTLARLTFNCILFVWDGANLVTPRSIFGMKKRQEIGKRKIGKLEKCFCVYSEIENK